jgi:hypothetical protein
MKGSQMKRFVAVFLVSVGLLSCGGSPAASACAREVECAKKAGQTASQTQCENDAKIQAELAAGKGCGNELNASYNCQAKLTCDQDFDRNCGAEAQKYLKCIQ